MVGKMRKGAVSLKFSMRNVFGKIIGKPYTITLRPNLARKHTQKFDRVLLPPSSSDGPPPSRREAEW